ncbi:MAG: peptide chain release factor-like protein [Fibrobacter sp.]|jgi:hypothetical protein|nr:peptide chain release factor-like protein [Fibrobacter sp.]
MHRDVYLKMSLDELIRHCKIKHFQGGGPGGQHRNKTNTGIVLIMPEYGLETKSCESRSAHENKTHALHRMRLAIALNVREPLKPLGEYRFPGSEGRIRSSNFGFPQFIAEVLDIAAENNGNPKPAAEIFGLTASALNRILGQEKIVLEKLKTLRKE